MSLAIVLLEDASYEIIKLPGYYGAWMRKYETPFEVFKGTEQIIYGTYSGMTHADRAPYVPVAVLRTAIELRLRHAFGITNYINPAKPEEMIPIDLSKLFEAIQTQQTEIEFAVNLHDIWKIYRWSNFYLHGGVRDFPWVPGFLLQYLRPIFADERKSKNGSWNINGGIRMNRKAWREVRQSLQTQKKTPSLSGKLTNAWRELWPAKKRQLELPAFNEELAQCMFLD